MFFPKRFERCGVADAESIYDDYNIRVFLLEASRSTCKAGSKVVRKPDCGVDLIVSQEARISSLLALVWQMDRAGPQGGRKALYTPARIKVDVECPSPTCWAVRETTAGDGSKNCSDTPG